MRIVTDLVDLQGLTVDIRALAFPENALERHLPTVVGETVDYRLAEAGRYNQATVVRAFDTPAPLISRPGVVETKGGLPAISAMDVITETDSIRARRLNGLSNADAFAPTVPGSAARTTQAVQNKYELLRGQALSTGGISIAENGVVQAVDFGVPTANKFVRPVAWTNTSADIVNDLVTWHQQFIDSSGGPAGEIVTSSRVFQQVLRSPSVRALFSPQPSVVTPDAARSILAAYGLPPIVTYDRRIEDAAGTLQRVIAEDRVVFLPGDGATVGQTQLGITAEAVELASRGVLEADLAPGLTAVTYVIENPVSTAVLTASIGLPVVQRPRSIVTATVL
ncbi:major capsid protein [Pseudokineococcus lusitanus]|uniref:Major capsid protein E n=1 Tax=Pseudokineococcus lusitanus TaxID=763993 RepID=A0A3N1HUC7_9ACTN|nr:major capsid protein [Pseudokineococcus lusitanus]ROP45942.1 major capsid protein E [Pseudokineococcus lusitanus]